MTLSNTKFELKSQSYIFSFNKQVNPHLCPLSLHQVNPHHNRRLNLRVNHQNHHRRILPKAVKTYALTVDGAYSIHGLAVAIVQWVYALIIMNSVILHVVTLYIPTLGQDVHLDGTAHGSLIRNRK